MSNLDKLIALFEKFPGIGGRQARRFAFHLLTMPAAEISELSRLITSLQDSVVECESCHRFFSNNGGSASQCGICSDENRDHTKVLIVASDADIQPIERSGVYDGLYFVLGGTVPLLDNENTKKLRGGALKSLVSTRKANGLSEIILGLPVNPDGENTSRYLEGLLKESIDEKTKLSYLGRGLSMGSELEYADPETIKNALKNRA